MSNELSLAHLQTAIALARTRPACSGGYTPSQIGDILGERAEDFWKWMSGQTFMICTGERYNHDTKEYEKDCEVAHGSPIVYSWDLKRYLAGLPVVD